MTGSTSGDTLYITMGIVLAVGSLGIALLAIAVWFIRPRLIDLIDDVRNTMTSAQRAMLQAEELLREVRDKNLAGKLDTALSAAQGAVGRFDPLAADLTSTLSGARELLDDATQTSQSVRARIDDLAATQAELNALTSALTDVMTEIRDREVAAKLANVLSDASLLTADIGILTENANSYLEQGRPLVSNIRNVVDSARQRAGGISATLGGIREGIKGGGSRPTGGD